MSIKKRRAQYFARLAQHRAEEAAEEARERQASERALSLADKRCRKAEQKLEDFDREMARALGAQSLPDEDLTPPELPPVTRIGVDAAMFYGSLFQQSRHLWDSFPR